MSVLLISSILCFSKKKKMIRADELESIPEDLSNVQETKQGIEGITRYRDRVKLWNGTLLVILGLENQDRIHYAMPERIMLSDALQYELQRKRIAARHRKKKDLRGDEFLSGFAKNDRLYPVLTAVIYYGEKPWDGPRCLGDMVALPEVLKPYFTDYPVRLFQILGNDGRDFENADVRTVLRNADALRSGRMHDIDKKIDAETAKYLAAFVNSKRILKLAERKEEIDMCTALEEMIKEGENRGKKEGKAEGKAEDILELLGELGRVSRELQETVMKQKDIEVLKKWLKKAARAESVEEFQIWMN